MMIYIPSLNNRSQTMFLVLNLILPFSIHPSEFWLIQFNLFAPERNFNPISIVASNFDLVKLFLQKLYSIIHNDQTK